MLDTLG
jgi:hypothetical protein